MASEVSQRTAQVRAWLHRMQTTAVLIRGAVYATGAAALLTAGLGSMDAARLIVIALLLPVLPLWHPHRGWPTVVIITSVVLWATGSTSGEYLGAFVTGALLYLHHTAAAQAVAVRTDTYVHADVLFGWLRRSGLVLLASAVVALPLTLIPGLFGRTDTLAVSMAGVAAVLGVLMVVAWQVHRRR